MTRALLNSDNVNFYRINAVSAGIRHFQIGLEEVKLAPINNPLACRKSRPPRGEQSSVSMARRRGYETVYASPFHHVGMRRNPFFPQLHAEP
jgi:hypothetical protein